MATQTEDLEPIDFENLGRFSIGKTSRTLYFDGQRVHTDALVSLTPRQAKFAGAAAIAAIVAGASTFGYWIVYTYDTLIRTKSPIQAEISTPKALPFPVALSPVVPNLVTSAPEPQPPPQKPAEKHQPPAQQGGPGQVPAPTAR
jgi:hypothetical protein